MRKYERPRFKRPRKYPGKRSIPLRNPQVVRWPVDVGRPNPRTGPTSDCFDDGDAVWYAVSVKDGQLIRITGEQEAKPKYVVVHRRENDVELRLYYAGTLYHFVQLYYCIGKVFGSVGYRGRDAAMLAFSRGNIRWRESRPLRGEN